jgi:hypothetical protein
LSVRTHWNDVTFPVDDPLGSSVGDILVWDGEKWVAQADLDVWDHVMTLVDENTGTVLSLDTGVMSPIYDIWKIIGEVGNHTGSANAFLCRLNGIVGSVYNRINLATSVSSTIGTTSWQLCSMPANRRGLSFEYTLRGATFDSGGLTEPTIHGGMDAGANGSASLIRGNIDATDGVNMSRIQLFSGGNAVGRVSVFGMNISP